MTNEQMQFNACRNAYEETIKNIAHEDANKAVIIEQLAQQLKAVTEERDGLKAKYEPEKNLEAVT